MKKMKKKNNVFSCMLVSGNHGSGKSSSVTAILNVLDYEIRRINLNKIATSKRLSKPSQNKKKNKVDNSLDEYIEKLLKGEHVYDKLIFTNKKNKEKKKFVIVIDRVESSALPAEKKIISAILKINEKYWYAPIIFITNNKHSKILTFLKTNTYSISFNPPTNVQLFDLLLKICQKEKIVMQKEHEGGKLTAEKIVEYSQNDYRKLFSIIQELTIFNKFITLDDVENYCSYSKKKDIDSNIYLSTGRMITQYDSIGECLRLYNSDKTTYPLMIQENYPMFINEFCKVNDKKTFKVASEIANSMATGDKIDNYIFSDQNWDMVEVHGYFSCVKPAYLLSNENQRGLLEYVTGKLKYPQDFNRTSIKQINRRNVTKTSEFLTNFEILDSLLKINKIIESKSAFPSQLKRKFAELLKK